MQRFIAQVSKSLYFSVNIFAYEKGGCEVMSVCINVILSPSQCGDSQPANSHSPAV